MTSDSFIVNCKEVAKDLKGKKCRWCLAKDDVTPQDIFRLTNEGPDERAIIAKYCFQDCNLVHNLMMKNDIFTGMSEIANICYVPVEFIVMRGQGIKLLSFIAKKCSEKNTLMPVLDVEKGDKKNSSDCITPPVVPSRPKEEEQEEESSTKGIDDKKNTNQNCVRI